MMISQPPKQKGFIARHWGLLLAGGLVIGFIFLAALGAGAYFLLRTNVQATSIEYSMEKPEFGKTLTAKVALQNKGLLDADYHAVLLVDGEEAATGDVKLASKESQTLSFDLKDLKAGEHKISIAGKDGKFTVYNPANLKVTAITVEPDQLIAGEKARLKVTVKNSGELPGDFESPLTMDGAKLVVVKGTVEPGEEKVIVAEFTPADRGSHTLALEDQDQSVNVFAPAIIEVTGLKLSKTYAAPREEVTATVTVQNSGDLPGKYNVTLSINGAADQQKEVTVEPNGTLDVSFTVSKSKAGSYSVQSGNYTEPMRIVVLTRPRNGTFLIKNALGTARDKLGYMQIFNNTKKDGLFVLARKDNPSVAVLAVYVRAGQNVIRFLVKKNEYYGYFTLGGQFDSASKRFLSGAEYYRDSYVIDFNGVWYQFRIPADYYKKISESDFPK